MTLDLQPKLGFQDLVAHEGPRVGVFAALGLVSLQSCESGQQTAEDLGFLAALCIAAGKGNVQRLVTICLPAATCETACPSP